MGNTQAVSRTQKIIVDPANSSISIINAGPIGPRGFTGPPDAQSFLTIDGQIMTRFGGGLAGISRADLAADPAFTSYWTAHLAAADPHPGYLTPADGDALFLTPAEADTSYVNVSGDTMTGPLTLQYTGGQALVIKDASAYIAWFNGSTREGYLQGAAGGLTLNSEVGRLSLIGADGFNMTPFKINGYQASETASGSRIVLTTGAGYIFGNYINMSANVVSGYPSYFAGQSGGDNYMRWYDRTGTFQTSGQIQTNYQGGFDYSGGGIYVNKQPEAAIGMHPGGTAGTIRMTQNSAYFYFHGTSYIAYYNLMAAAFVLSSSRNRKQDITPWPPLPSRAVGADVNTLTALGIVRNLEVVSYRRRHDEHMVEAWPTERRRLAHIRLNEFRTNRDLEPYPYKLHDCDDSNCIGTSLDPCSWYRNWDQPSLGLIVEDTVDIAPELVRYGPEGDPSAIDIHSHVSLLHAAIKELENRLYELEGVSI